MKKILITGSCGFLMGNLIRKAIYDQSQLKPQDRKYSFVSIDRVNFNKNSLYWNKNHIFHIADIRDSHIIDRIFQIEQPDIVIQGAASTHVDNSLADPNDFITNNVLGTQVIVNACVKHKVSKLVLISTDESLGELKDNETSWTENAPLNPRNPYSASKAAGELIVKAAHNAFNLTYNITRSSNCYGTYQQAEKLIPKAIKCLLAGEKIPIYGQGLQIRDWTHATDNSSAIMTVIEKGLPNEIYHISANQEFTNLEVIHEICKYMGKNSEDSIQFIKDPRGNAHDYRYSIDSSKIRSLGWKPEIQFKKSLGESCINWYLDNQWWFK